MYTVRHWSIPIPLQLKYQKRTLNVDHTWYTQSTNTFSCIQTKQKSKSSIEAHIQFDFHSNSSFITTKRIKNSLTQYFLQFIQLHLNLTVTWAIKKHQSSSTSTSFQPNRQKSVNITNYLQFKRKLKKSITWEETLPERGKKATEALAGKSKELSAKKRKEL